MKTAAIIAEYNPFHNGHKHHIDATRAAGATHIIAVMSGSLVQRGTFAAFSKHTRAEAALQNGADLVLELPCIYALASAQRFAEGAVHLIDRLGIATHLSFGSECGNLQTLSDAADALLQLDDSPLLQRLLKEGHSYPTAKQLALAQVNKTAASILTMPNDTLGVEYLCAIRQSKSDLQPIVIPRVGAAHDSTEAADGIASASHIRTQLAQNTPFNAYIPKNAATLYDTERQSGQYQIDSIKFETAVLYALKSCSKADFEALPDVSEGLHNRLYTAARQARTLDEFYCLAKTKRYTHARLRRISLYALMGMRKADLEIEPAYVHVLGANARGKELLAKARKASEIPCITAFSKAETYNERLAFLDSRATDLHALLSKTPLACGQDYFNNAILVDESENI